MQASIRVVPPIFWPLEIIVGFKGFRFGFDPAPYYPSLYHFMGERDPHIKSLLMACRAEMLRSGLLAALKAITDRNGIHLIAAMAEPKLPACSWLSGDTLADSVYSPCAVQENAYLYGMNSTHLAASAADNYGSKYVSCELFRDYNKLTTDIVYKDAMNAFGHGANLLIAHWNSHVIQGNIHRRAMDRFRMEVMGQEGRSTFSAFVARTQALLRGGSRVNESPCSTPSTPSTIRSTSMRPRRTGASSTPTPPSPATT